MEETCCILGEWPPKVEVSGPSRMYTPAYLIIWDIKCNCDRQFPQNFTERTFSFATHTSSDSLGAGWCVIPSSKDLGVCRGADYGQEVDAFFCTSVQDCSRKSYIVRMYM